MFKKNIDKVIMHCSATPDETNPRKRWYKLDIEEVRQWHKARGWRDVGYHLFIKRNGTIQYGRKIGAKGAHTLGENHNIGVCYAGMSEPTDKQKKAMRRIMEVVRKVHGLSLFDWHCHSEFANKECPGFSRVTLHNILKGEI